MKISKSIFKICSLLLASVLLFTACGSGSEDVKGATNSTEPVSNIKVGVVLTTSGKGDKSYNDSAIEGLELLKNEHGITYNEIQPKEVADFEKSFEFLAKEKYDIIFGIGFNAANGLAVVAEKYPDTNFVILDYDYGDAILPNVKSITFKEQEGSFLAGVLAAETTTSNTVGFVGGMEGPMIQKFEVGFTEGVHAVKPDATVLVSYVSADAQGFNNPSRAKEITVDMINKGAEIVYHAAGGSGSGVLEAASEGGILAIGVDSNQNWVRPGSVIASMIKRVDISVVETVLSQVDGTIEMGTLEIRGLASDGVGLTDLTNLTIEETEGISAEDQKKMQDLKDSISQETKDKIESYKEQIISGDIVVSSSR